VEPYFGCGARLFCFDPDDPRYWVDGHKYICEIRTNIDDDLINFWEVLRGEETFEEFRRIVDTIPMGRRQFRDATAILEGKSFSDVERAAAFFAAARQSRSGMMEEFTSISRMRTRRQMNGNVSEWIGAGDGLPDVHRRLRRVPVENIDAMGPIPREDTSNTFCYLEPPYYVASHAAAMHRPKALANATGAGLAETRSNVSGLGMPWSSRRDRWKKGSLVRPKSAIASYNAAPSITAQAATARMPARRWSLFRVTRRGSGRSSKMVVRGNGGIGWDSWPPRYNRNSLCRQQFIVR
jgi:site-specific DNA-adenine methylase